MFQAGVVDPAKVTRSALINAASVGSMLLTTEAAVVDIPEENQLLQICQQWQAWAVWEE